MHADPEIPDLTPSGGDLVDRGQGVSTVHYPDGSIGVRHLCTRTRPPVGFQVFSAPALRLSEPAGHQVVTADPLTVTPSVACGDCGLHGWITDGTWRTA